MHEPGNEATQYAFITTEATTCLFVPIMSSCYIIIELQKRNWENFESIISISLEHQEIE